MSHFYNEYNSKLMLKEYGLPTGDFILVKNQEEAAKAAAAMGYPVVMKIVSDQIVHKTEARGIKLGINSASEASKVYEELIANGKAYNKSAIIDGVMVAPMVPAGTEVIIGGVSDAQFGPVVMFGLGGVFVEVFKDVQFRMAPLTKKEALRTIRSIRAFPMLNGARGKEPANLDALSDLFVKVSEYMADHPEVKEIDLNPVSCFGNNVQILDASISIEK